MSKDTLRGGCCLMVCIFAMMMIGYAGYRVHRGYVKQQCMYDKTGHMMTLAESIWIDLCPCDIDDELSH